MLKFFKEVFGCGDSIANEFEEISKKQTIAFEEYTEIKKAEYNAKFDEVLAQLKKV